VVITTYSSAENPAFQKLPTGYVVYPAGRIICEGFACELAFSGLSRRFRVQVPFLTGRIRNVVKTVELVVIVLCKPAPIAAQGSENLWLSNTAVCEEPAASVVDAGSRFPG